MWRQVVAERMLYGESGDEAIVSVKLTAAVLSG
jgi:hypothetical protein